jgi:hypothetical protein
MLKNLPPEGDRYLVYLVCLVNQDQLDEQNNPDEPDQPVLPSRLARGYPAGNDFITRAIAFPLS